MNRRSFLATSAGFAFLYAHDGFARMAKRPGIHGALVCPYSKAGLQSHGLIILDLDHREFRNLPTPFAIHKVTLDSVEAGIGFGIGSYGDEIVKIDLKNGRLLAVKSLGTRFSFPGHCQISKNGSIYATVSEKVKGGASSALKTGLVRIGRQDLSVAEELLFPQLEGLGNVHDLQFASEPGVLITTGGRYLIKFDTIAKKIVQSHKIDFDISGSILNHFAYSEAGNFGIQSNVFSAGPANRAGCEKGALVLFDGGEKKFRILRQGGELAKHLDQDLFGLCLNASGTVVCVGNRWDNYLSFWNMQSGAFLKGLELPHPTGTTLTKDRSYFVVTTLEGLKYFDAETLEQKSNFADFKKDFASVLGAVKDKSRLFHSTSFLV